MRATPVLHTGAVRRSVVLVPVLLGAPALVLLVVFVVLRDVPPVGRCSSPVDPVVLAQYRAGVGWFTAVGVLLAGALVPWAMVASRDEADGRAAGVALVPAAGSGALVFVVVGLASESLAGAAVGALATCAALLAGLRGLAGRPTGVVLVVLAALASLPWTAVVVVFGFVALLSASPAWLVLCCVLALGALLVAAGASPRDEPWRVVLAASVVALVVHPLALALVLGRGEALCLS